MDGFRLMATCRLRCAAATSLHTEANGVAPMPEPIKTRSSNCWKCSAGAPNGPRTLISRPCGIPYPVSLRPKAPPSKHARANTHLQATHGSDVLELHASSSCRPFALSIRRNSRLLRLGQVAQFVGPVAQPLDVELHEGVRRAGCDGERVELAGRHRGNADLTVLASLVPGHPPSR